MATIPQFESRPEVEVIVYRHRPTCKFSAPDKLGRCSCRKHLYVREARLRIATGKKSWEAAREFAAQWQDANDPAKIKRREQAAKEQASLKLIDDAFDDFIAAKKSASDNPDGFVATESKFRTLKKQLLIFLAKSNNGLHETERVALRSPDHILVTRQVDGNLEGENLLEQDQAAGQLHRVLRTLH
jgi:hypothetical protein